MAEVKGPAAEIKPVLRLNPNGHRHHDVLASALEMFTLLKPAEKELSDMRYVIATQLLFCRCKEGKLLRQTIRAGVGVALTGECRIILTSEPGAWNWSGRRRTTHFHSYQRKKELLAKGYNPAPVSECSTFHIKVGVDVVLTLAGLGSLLRTVIHDEPMPL